jgi:hypothetical protein
MSTRSSLANPVPIPARRPNTAAGMGTYPQVEKTMIIPPQFRHDELFDREYELPAVVFLSSSNALASPKPLTQVFMPLWYRHCQILVKDSY